MEIPLLIQSSLSSRKEMMIVVLGDRLVWKVCYCALKSAKQTQPAVASTPTHAEQRESTLVTTFRNLKPDIAWLKKQLGDIAHTNGRLCEDNS
jgi:hypothetical protein